MLLFRVLICLLFLLPIFGWGAEIFVAPGGSDSNPGTKEKPLASVAIAVRKAREMRRLNDPAINGGIRIIVAGGTYRFAEPLFIRPEDSGTESSPTIIQAAKGARPVFSGGVPVTGWKRVSSKVPGLSAAATGRVWVADAPLAGGALLPFRQLWINDVKAVRARDRNGDSMNRILAWNHETESCWIPWPEENPATVEGLEMFIHQWWAIAVLRVKHIEVRGDSARLHFHQPESRIQSEHPWPAPWISKKTGNSAYYLTNALQFLDSPGEWHLDTRNRKLYYWPRSGEDMTKATATAPLLENLVRIEGTIDQPVRHLFFKGLSFTHTGWLRPGQQGHVPLQSGMFLLDAYKLKVPGTPDKKGLENQAWIGRPPAAVEVTYAGYTGFEDCRFQHLAATGLDYKKGTFKGRVVGNLFRDIGGTGIQAGVFSDEAFETHLPYKPSDEREVCRNTYIGNNLVTDVTNEDWGCVGIGAGYVQGLTIEHNEVSEVSYTGISLGWGWTKTINAMHSNTVAANKIHHYARHMYDVSGIYTLSAQPGALIQRNAIDSIYKAPYAHDPEHWFYLYLDEGSSFITVKDNWSPSEKFLKNANGPGNIWENNGPQVADSIRKDAGLQAEYQYLLREPLVPTRNKPINQL